MARGGGRPWVRASLVLVLGAMLVFAVVAMVIPPSVTDPSGLEGSMLAGARLETPLEVAIEDSSDVEIARVAIPPGGNGGWHSHRGYVLVSVLSGVATFYDRDDPTCAPQRYRAGDAILETPGHPHITRNEGPQPLVLYVVGDDAAGQGQQQVRPRFRVVPVRPMSSTRPHVRTSTRPHVRRERG